MVFSLFLGVALAWLGVFAAATSVVTTQGIGILRTAAKVIGGFSLGLAALWAVLIAAAVAAK